MSSPMAFSKPHIAATWRAAMAPAAMPEPASLQGEPDAVRGVITPPPECRRSRSPS